MNESYLKIIYSGSFVNAQYIAGLLEEAGIECVINNEFQTSLAAGWAAPGTENSVKVLVAKENIDSAVQAIKSAKESK
tara:strand:+ start:471 stop:704 length:234 start_codon:yes stop_codon:yes gene_type:complete